ncbi:MAG: AMP-binding protein [Bacteroidales bacterium]|nr:AMP-binding protein [Bacteroidales bacterium]
MIDPRKAETLAELYRGSTETYKELEWSSFADGSHKYTFSSFRSECDSMAFLLTAHGLTRGDKVAILSENMPNWGLAFFSVTAFGMVAVPILPDCSENEVNNILHHSEAKAVFVSRKQQRKVSPENRASLSLVLAIETLEVLSCSSKPSRKAMKYSDPRPEDLAVLIYTSGTSGNAKGVMLSHRNLCHNLVSSPGVHKTGRGTVWLSILPLAHTFELSLGMLYPFAYGSRLYYLETAPTPSVLMKAFAQVHPRLMCSVPLVIEKIYRKSIVPAIKGSPVLSFMDRNLPGLLYPILGSKLKKVFGGNLEVIAIGGAKLDSEVERFLKLAHFPYAIGYGMTETAPLLCAAPLGKTSIGSTGYAVKGVEMKLLNPDPATGEGEIVVKGPNVMIGYYKDEKRTAEMFTEDGWMHTRDLAVIDAKGNYSIKGRLSNMILGASGENIYPEEIEMVLNACDKVEESLVISENGRLVALIKLWDNFIDWDRKGEETFEAASEALKSEILRHVNKAVSRASQISSIRFIKEPFEKTATKKIRRFLYNCPK